MSCQSFFVAVPKGRKVAAVTPPNPQAPRPTLYDVARLAGVSPSLVSLVLQNPDKVSEKRRAAVRAAITELGYRPSRAATALASNRTKSIGLVIDDYRNLWFVDLLRGMESALTEHGCQVMLADSRPGENRIREAADGLLAMHVDGLVIAAEPGDAMLTGTGVPTVVAGWRNGVPAEVDLITNDDDGAGAIAVQHLLELRHTKIGHLTGSGGAAAHRKAGFQARLGAAGVDVRIVGEDGGTSEEDGYASACWLLDHHPETTAIIAANDTMALGTLGAIKDRGRAVPADISVIGYDNTQLARSRYLELTSMGNQTTSNPSRCDGG
jgi:DNA-binding LacI/PurR family transcriptional regulator